MPSCRAQAYREPDGQYSWMYFKNDQFVEVGGQNQTLAAAFNAMRDKIALEANVGNTQTVSLEVLIP